MKKHIIFGVLLTLAVIITGCGDKTEEIKKEARFIRHDEIINNFETYKGDLVKVDGVVWLTDDYENGDDIPILNIIDGEYSITIVPNTTEYKPYNGEYITVYGDIVDISKEPVFFEVKAVQIRPKIIEQTENPSDELKNDVLIQEFIKN